jgi:hypothetical protein
MSAATLSCSIARWVSVPGPPSRTESLPLLAFAYAMNSGSVLTGSDGGTTSTFGVPPTMAIGVKSFTGIVGQLAHRGIGPWVPT